MSKRVSKLLNLTHRVCTICKVDKPSECFQKRKIVSGIVLNSNCKECRKQLETEWIKNNIESARKIKSKWKKANRNKVNAATRTREKIRYKTDIKFKLAKTLRNRFKEVLKTKKSKSALKLLGCSLDEFKIHIEQQFQVGMTWDNHGQFGWHMDHIKPLCSFDLTDSEQVKQAFHYTNIRPLWWSDNLGRNKPKYEQENTNA